MATASARTCPGLRPNVIACTLACAWLAITGDVRAEPVVRVRADSRIELGVTHLDVGMSITGALRDELGHGLSDRPLSLTAIPMDDPEAPFDTTVRTNPAGEFSLDIADGNHDYRLLASFEGDLGHRGVRVERSVERARSDVRLELRVAAGSRLDLDAAEVVLNAIAESDAGGSGIALRLSDETGAELALAHTDARGHARFVVPTERFGPPGTGLLRVESLRDEHHAEAQTEARIIRSRNIAIELRTERARIELGNELDVDGQVRSAAGPCPNLPVGLFIGREHVRTVMSDERGAFSARLSLDGASPATTSVSARVEADATGAHAAAESTRTLVIVAPEPLPLTWLLGLLATAAGGAMAIARWRRPVALGEADPRGPFVAIALGSVRHGGPAFDITGTVTSESGESPITGARIEVIHAEPDRSCTLYTDAQGRFASPTLTAGALRIRIDADGWAARSLELTLPHHGEGAGMSVRLESLRNRALRAFRAAVEPYLPFPRAFAVWTTREIRAFLAQRRPEQRVSLGELSLDVERATYAAAPPTEHEVALIERRAGALLTPDPEAARTAEQESASESTNSDPQRPSAR